MDLNEICHLTAELADVPMAVIALTEGVHHRVLSQLGLGPDAALSCDAFCEAGARAHGVVAVEDAAADERFRRHPLVTAKNGVRFFAAVPLVNRSGTSIGALCVMDRVARQMDAAQRAVLSRMAVIVSGLFKARVAAELSDAQRQVLGRQARELWRKQQLLAQTERLANIGGWEYDVLLHDIVWSDEIYRIAEMPVGVPLSMRDVLSMYPSPDRMRISRAFHAAATTGEAFSLELQMETPKGTRKWVRIMGESEFSDGAVSKVFGSFQDITSTREVETELWRAANQDALTGLANRACFNREFDRLLKGAEASGHGLGLMLLDLDFLKDINDTLGHEAGDTLIVTVGERIKEALGPWSIVARLGGDEFAIALPDVETLAQLNRVGRKIIKALSKTVRYRSQRLPLRGTFGGAMFPIHGTTRRELLQAADIALYRAKADSKGGFVAFDPSMRAHVNARVEIMRQIRSALERGEIVPFYQPKVELKSGRIMGFEALARWVSSNGVIRAPGEFSQAFQDPDIAFMFGERMLKAITADIRTWLDAGVDPGRIALNVATSEFSRGDFSARIEKAFQRKGLPLTHLTVEVTENVFLSRRTDRVGQTLENLQKKGVLIALDDFGTGFASLTHLKQFPVDLIKIDKSFVHDLTRDQGDAAIVEMVLDLGRRLGIPVIAEGIETEEQFTALRVLECDYGQGYLFGQPVPGSSVKMLLAAWSPASRACKIIPFEGASQGRVA